MSTAGHFTADCTAVVIGRNTCWRLLLVTGIKPSRTACHTCPETLALLREPKIHIRADETRAAVALYNKLADEGAVSGLFHPIC